MRTLLKRAALIGLVAALIGLVPMALRAQDKPSDPMAAVEAVIERYDTAMQAFNTAYRAASSEERAKLERPDVSEYVIELVSLAKGNPKSDAAAKAWMKVIQLAPQGDDPEVIGSAVTALLRDHAASPEIAGLGNMIASAGRSIGTEKATAYLRQVASGAPRGEAQAGALLALARSLAESEPADDSAEAKELDGVLAQIQKDYADLNDSRGRSYASLAEGMAFERKHLKVGLPVPEIESADLQGVTFKLSDYRGKVVLLDFWGNW